MDRGMRWNVLALLADADKSVAMRKRALDCPDLRSANSSQNL
jgi:hypothetical protein